jgi:RNA polymerase sigma-70 factor, ECF subfamily
LRLHSAAELRLAIDLGDGFRADPRKIPSSTTIFPWRAPAIPWIFPGIGRRPAGSAFLEPSTTVTQADRAAAFEAAVLPHARAAFALASWLTRDPHDAEDVVQEAWLRAFKYFDGFGGGDARSWFLTIVRNSFRRWRERHREAGPVHEVASLDEGDGDEVAAVASPADDPAQALLRESERETVNRAIGELPLDYREVLVLRELEGLSYREIAAIAAIPIGTVMSRLARARERLRARLAAADPDQRGTSREARA